MPERTNTAEARALVIVGVALTLGPLLFLGVALYLRHFTDFGKPAPAPFLSWIALPVAGMALLTAFLLPRPKGNDAGRLRAHFITRLAIVEGGALFATVAYLLEGQVYPLIAAATCISFMATLLLPTPSRVDEG